MRSIGSIFGCKTKAVSVFLIKFYTFAQKFTKNSEILMIITIVF